MTPASSLPPDVHRAIAYVLNLEPVIEHLIGFSPSLPAEVEKGSELHTGHIRGIGTKFAPNLNLPPEAPRPAVGLTTAEIATIIEAFAFVNEEHLRDTEISESEITERMNWIRQAQAIFRYEEDDGIVGIRG